MYLKKNNHKCPYLFLAPMEGVGDRPFRKAMSLVGGFDEAVTEFIRVPVNAHVESLARVYQSDELGAIPLAAQVMGSDPELIALMGKELEKRGAGRIDLNCGCPSNTVTGKGAGSSLLKDPEQLHLVASSLKNSVSVPVTVKMRSGFDDTFLFKQNLQAVEASGVDFVTLHPRTKKDGYSSKADWTLIAEAKQVLKIPVVGNGDITCLEKALLMLDETGCDALMIGRGAVMDPFIFKKIKAHFANEEFKVQFEDYQNYLSSFLRYLDPKTSDRTQVNKLKQILGFIFKSDPRLEEKKSQMLSSLEKDPHIFLEGALNILKQSLYNTILSSL